MEEFDLIFFDEPYRLKIVSLEAVATVSSILHQERFLEIRFGEGTE